MIVEGRTISLIGSCLFGFSAALGLTVEPLLIAGNFTYIDPAIIASIVGFILYSDRRVTRYAALAGSCLVTVVFFLAFSSLLSADISGDFFLRNGRFLYYAVCIMVFSGCCRDVSDLERIVKSYCIGIVCTLVYAAYSWSIDPQFYQGAPYLHNELISRNPLYYYVVVALPLVYYFAISKRSQFYWALLGTLLLVLVLTMSKGAWLVGVIFCLAIFLSQSGNFTNKVMLSVLAISITAGISLYFGTFAFFTQRLNNSVTSLGKRLDLVEIGFKVGLEKFPFGVGVDGYKHHAEIIGRGVSADPHNVWLWLWSEGGVFAAAAFGVLLCVTVWRNFMIRSAVKRRKNDLANFNQGMIILGIVVTILSMLTGTVASDKYFYFFLIISFNYFRLMRSVDRPGFSST